MTKTVPFDAAKYLTEPKDQAELLNEAFASGNASFISAALGIVARARGMAEVAREAGVTREALYKSLSADGDPKLSTLIGVMRALNISLHAKMGAALSRAAI
jgi:probable addiction module antidote protein